MKLYFEFDLDIIGTDPAAFDKIRHHVEKMLEQIKRYPEQLTKPNLGYSCGEDAEIEAQWRLLSNAQLLWGEFDG